MGCHTIGLVRCCADEQVVLGLSQNIVKPKLNTRLISCGNVVSLRRSKGGAGANNLSQIKLIARKRHHDHQPPCMWRIYNSSTTVGLEEQSSTQSQFDHDDDDVDEKPPSSHELKALLVDAERTKLIKKLSEANQQNRFLKRQLQGSEDALVNFKRELAGIELDVQALVALAEEVTNAGIPVGTRKINGKYIHSHLLSRLEAVQKKLQDQTKGVEAARAKEVFIFWIGMAESVQVMGTFDGWSQGEHLSPEYNGSYTKFSTTLLLRPGSYQVKFLVDGEWRVSPEFPTIGEGLTENNLLVVE